jgi:aminoglycoside phosphotransferase (APT) family kinase protein
MNRPATGVAGPQPSGPDPAAQPPMAERLASWARHHYGPEASVESVAPMPGNAGLSFGFDVGRPGESGAASGVERLVIRVPPAGVRRKGNTDVLRQVPLLQAAAADGVPVPAVRWWGDDERWFGVPYLVVDRLPGRSLNLFAPEPDFFDLSPAGVRAVFRQAVEALVATHRVDWRSRLPEWDEPRSLEAEIAFWDPILGKGDDEGWISAGRELRDALLLTRPAEPDPGLVHGDFYSNNWVVDGEGRLRAVVDWEIAAIGPSLLDLGWLCMMYDPESWPPAQRARMGWAPAVEDIVGLYEDASGQPVPDVAWYRALAGFRLAAITSLNVRLQRRGQRPPDPVWDLMADSYPYRVAQARRLAGPGA